MAEAHEWSLRRLREMAGPWRAGLSARQRRRRAARRGARALDAGCWWPHGRGLRLSIALVARLARERRWDVKDLKREIKNAIERAGAPV